MSQQKSKSDSTLREGCGCLLLAVVGVIGPLALLSIPPLFFSFRIKDKQVEIFLPFFREQYGESAKQYISSMNKGQQAKFAENGAFSNSVAALEIGLRTETNNYKCSTRSTKTAAFNYAVAKKSELKSYFGGVFLVPAKKLDRNADQDEMTTVSILCETEKPEKRTLFRVKQKDEPDELAEPIYQNGEVICGKGTTEVTR
jgi:type IV pilus assembly protein PilA